MLHTTESPIYSEYGHDEDFAELIALFVDELPSRMQGLREAVAGKNYTEGHRLAHQLKGAFGSYGFHPLTPVLQQLESAFHPPADADAIETSLQVVLEKVARVRKGSAS